MNKKKFLLLVPVVVALAFSQTRVNVTTQGRVRAKGPEYSRVLQVERHDGTPVSWVDSDGFLTEGADFTEGREYRIGNPGDSGASGLTIHSGNTAAKPGYLKICTSAGACSYLYPCGAGRWCQDSVKPGNLADNPLISANSTDVLDNKTVGHFIDWEDRTTSRETPPAGKVRSYFNNDRLCWLNSAGVEKCVLGQ